MMKYLNFLFYFFMAKLGITQGSGVPVIKVEENTLARVFIVHYKKKDYYADDSDCLWVKSKDEKQSAGGFSHFSVYEVSFRSTVCCFLEDPTYNRPRSIEVEF